VSGKAGKAQHLADLIFPENLNRCKRFLRRAPALPESTALRRVTARKAYSMFTDYPTRAVAAARTLQLDHLSAAEATRAARSRTRRRLHEPRPPITPEIRARIGQWKAQIKAACLAGYISKGGDKYLHELLTIHSVARGDYCLYSDAEMGQRINIKGRTIRQHRKDADIHGLVEVLGHGKDRKPCMVRPILRDGSPVFPDLKSASKSATFSRLTRQISVADLLLTDTLKTEDYPPLPPAVPDGPEEGERVFDRVKDEEPAKPAESARPAGTAQAAPAEPPGPRAPTQPPGTGNAPADSARAPSATQPEPDAIEPAKPAMSFPEFWLAMGRTGPEGYARAKWGKLSAAEKTAIQERLSHPRSWAADMWAGKWLECRVWEEAEAVPVAAPVDRSAWVWLHERAPEFRAWQRDLIATTGHGTPTDDRGGWWFPSKLPPLETETPPKAHASLEPLGFLRAVSANGPQHFT
jgi:hypothetical protein